MPVASETAPEQLNNPNPNPNHNISPTQSIITMSDCTQYERDLRSANKEWRRGKDSNVKWAHGSRYLSGISANYDDGGPFINGANAPDHMFAKFRPNKKPSEASALGGGGGGGGAGRPHGGVARFVMSM